MTTENNDKASTLGTSEKRRIKDTINKTTENIMEKEPFSIMDFAGNEENSQRIRLLRDHGKRRIQICYRVTERAWARLRELAQLFQMQEAEYCKAVLYKDLGIWTERLDYRKKRRKRK